MNRTIVNVQDVIDSSPLSSLQKVLLLLCFLTVAIDGFDTASIGFIAPAIRAGWGCGQPSWLPCSARGFLA